MKTTVPSVRTLVFFCTFFFSTQLFSQSIVLPSGTEFGIALGPSFFLGDLGGTYGRDKSESRDGGLKHLNMPLTKLAKGAFLAIYPKPWLGFRLGINHTTLEGDDAIIPIGSGEEQARKLRNLNFKSSVLEGHLLVEIAPTAFSEYYEEGFGLKPYGIVGIGAFKFNPKARLGDTWVPLQPLRTEGQGMTEYPDRKPYKLIAISPNMGAGLKYYFGNNKFVGLEVLYRFSPLGTNKDYIDDVSTNYIDGSLFDRYLSPDKAALATELHYREDEHRNSPFTRPLVGDQRGDPKEGDSWFTSIIRFGWRINDPNSPAGRAARQMRCPNYY